MALQPHEQRVVHERQELDVKRAKLAIFLGGPIFAGLPFEDKALLLTQEIAMRQYSDTLGTRIARFSGDEGGRPLAVSAGSPARPAAVSLRPSYGRLSRMWEEAGGRPIEEVESRIQSQLDDAMEARYPAPKV